MQFIVSGQRIAVENFVTGKLYTILWKNDTQVTLTCISIGADCVVFQGEAPLNLFTLTMQNADTIDTIEPTQLGTTNYNNLINKPQINGFDLIGNKTSAALGIRDVPSIVEADDGKILTANSDGTYTWQPAPSSGTTDYDELNNKPQINSVPLTGNVSLAELGAAAEADVPTTPADIGAEPAITSQNMLDADLVDDTSSTHKFATAAQLDQIETNETNISKFHKAANTDIYYQETAPTGDITDGSYWISTKGNYSYNKSSQLFDDTTDIKNAYLRQIDGIYLDSGSGSLSAVVAISGYKTIEISCNSKTLRIGYFTELPTNNANPIKYVNTEYFTYEQHTIAPIVPDNAAYIVVNCYLSTVEQVDGKTQSDIFDTLTMYGTWK